MAAQFWLGLTATPARRDGLGQLITWQLGPIRHTMTDEQRGTIAAAMAVDAGPQRLLFVHGTTFRAGDVELNAPGALAEVHRCLALDETRNAQIADDVAAALMRGRNCLVLTRRVAHVEALTAMLAARGHQALVLQGAMSATDRRTAVERLGDAKAGDGVLVIGTTPFIGEGFDAPALDTVHEGVSAGAVDGRYSRAVTSKRTAAVRESIGRSSAFWTCRCPRRRRRVPSGSTRTGVGPVNRLDLVGLDG